MGFVGLHVHPNVSDGTFSPSKVIGLAAWIGLNAITLTGHDTTAGITEVSRTGARCGVGVVPGIKVSSSYRGCEIRILRFFVYPEDPALGHVLKQLREHRDERNKEILQCSATNGVILTNEKLCAGNPNTAIIRVHVTRALLAQGLASFMGQVLKKYLQHDGQYRPSKACLSPGEAMDALSSGGAFVALARLFRYRLGDKGTQELTAFLAGMGIKGLEIHYSSYNRLESVKSQAMASACGLFSTEGSNLHGSNKLGISIGQGRGELKIPPLLLDDMKKAHQS